MGYEPGLERAGAGLNAPPRQLTPRNGQALRAAWYSGQMKDDSTL